LGLKAAGLLAARQFWAYWRDASRRPARRFVKDDKVFFSEEKKQKTFANWRTRCGGAYAP
jgi:hypothetical protein